MAFRSLDCIYYTNFLSCLLAPPNEVSATPEPSCASLPSNSDWLLKPAQVEGSLGGGLAGWRQAQQLHSAHSRGMPSPPTASVPKAHSHLFPTLAHSCLSSAPGGHSCPYLVNILTLRGMQLHSQVNNPPSAPPPLLTTFDPPFVLVIHTVSLLLCLLIYLLSLLFHEGKGNVCIPQQKQ